MKQRKKSEPLTGRAKLEAQLVQLAGPEAVDALQALSPAEMAARLTTLAQHEAETLDALAEDEAVAKAKAATSELVAPYRDTIKGIALRRRILAALLDERGTSSH